MGWETFENYFVLFCFFEWSTGTNKSFSQISSILKEKENVKSIRGYYNNQRENQKRNSF